MCEFVKGESKVVVHVGHITCVISGGKSGVGWVVWAQGCDATSARMSSPTDPGSSDELRMLVSRLHA